MFSPGCGQRRAGCSAMPAPAMVEKYGRLRIDKDKPPTVTTAIVPSQTQQRQILKSERPMTRYRRHFVVDARYFAEAEPLRASRQPTPLRGAKPFQLYVHPYILDRWATKGRFRDLIGTRAIAHIAKGTAFLLPRSRRFCGAIPVSRRIRNIAASRTG